MNKTKSKFCLNSKNRFGWIVNRISWIESPDSELIKCPTYERCQRRKKKQNENKEKTLFIRINFYLFAINNKCTRDKPDRMSSFHLLNHHKPMDLIEFAFIFLSLVLFHSSHLVCLLSIISPLRKFIVFHKINVQKVPFFSVRHHRILSIDFACCRLNSLHYHWLISKAKLMIFDRRHEFNSIQTG